LPDHEPHKIGKRNTLFNTDRSEWKGQHLNIVNTSVTCAIGPSVNSLQNRETQHESIVFHCE
jgi:glutathione peroxidase-family protein